MAKSIDSQLDQELQCSICYETFREPRMLPCQHTFCLECLESVSKLNNNGKTIECSLCRRNHDLPRENGVKALPKNILLQSLLDMKKTRGTASLENSESTKTGMDYSLVDMIKDMLEIKFLLDIKSFASSTSPPSEDEMKKIADETCKFESILDGMERRAKASPPSGTHFDSTKVNSKAKDENEMKTIIDEMSIMESLLDSMENRTNASPSGTLLEEDFRAKYAKILEMMKSLLDQMKNRANASLSGTSLEEKNSNSINAQFQARDDRKKIPHRGEVFIEIRNSNAPTSMTKSQKLVLFTWSYCIAFAGIAIAMIVIGNHYGQKVNGFHLFITTSLQIEGASFLLVALTYPLIFQLRQNTASVSARILKRLVMPFFKLGRMVSWLFFFISAFFALLTLHEDCKEEDYCRLPQQFSFFFHCVVLGIIAFLMFIRGCYLYLTDK